MASLHTFSRRLPLSLLAAAGILLAAGCVADDPVEGESGLEETESTMSETPSPQEPDYDPGLRPLVELARTDLAERLDIDPDQVVLTLAELRTWPDSSAGCPQEGMAYAQALTDGSEILFEAQGVSHRYVTGGDNWEPHYCPEG